MRPTLRALAWMVALMALFLGSSALAKTWQPEFSETGERFEFVTTGPEGEVTRYVLEIRATGETSPDGEPLFLVSTTNTNTVTRSALDDSAGASMGMGLNLLSLGAGGLTNPMVMMFLMPFFADAELEVGERMSLMGMGRVSVTGMETVAGREGFVVELEMGQGDERELTAVLVIDPELALPLVNRYYEDGELSSEMTLERYERY